MSPDFCLPQTCHASEREMKALLRHGFPFFVQRAFKHLNPTTVLRWGGYLDVLCSKLEACRQGKIRRLIVCLPPRHLKSICASVALPAFWLGKDPSVQILCVSYAQELALKHARDCREVLTSAWYRSLFPATRSVVARQAVEEFTTSQGGMRMATSVGGVLTGRGADVIIIDDPLKPAEALSDLQRKAVNEWYSNTLYSRLNHKETGCIILIMQRLHQDDLVGHVLEGGEPWELVSFPAIAEEDEMFAIPGLLGDAEPTLWRRRIGEPLNAEHESLETLQRTRETMTHYDWACQFQQRPVPRGGGLIKDAWWPVYEEEPRPFARIIQSWDTACKASELCDYSVCTTWGETRKGFQGRSGTHYFLLDVFRKRLNYPELRRAAKDLARRYSPARVLVEDHASGTQLVADLREDGCRNVTACRLPGDKVMRLHTQTALIENGYVHLPKRAPWLSDYREELGAFPRGRHDDQVDSTSQALAWMSSNRVCDWSGVVALGYPRTDGLLGGY